MKDNYTYPQEIWDSVKCEKAAKYLARDGLGTPYPWRGLISDHGSPYPSYGHTIKYNGGTFIDGEHYHSVTIPLPKVAKGFEIVNELSWGYFIRKVLKK